MLIIYCFIEKQNTFVKGNMKGFLKAFDLGKENTVIVFLKNLLSSFAEPLYITKQCGRQLQLQFFWI